MEDKPLQAEVLTLPAYAPVSRSPWWREVVDNRWLMVAMLFFVTAALGLPLLWISRAFSTRAKITLTLAVLAWTALVFWVFFLIMAWCWSQLRPVFIPGAF
jgi:hypothetical protein